MSTPERYDSLMSMLGHVEQADETPQCGTERVLTPWEMNMQATCECLSWRGSLDSLVRRNTEDQFGEGVYADFPVHTLPTLTVAHTLMDKGVFSEVELRSKMKEVRTRFEEV